MPPLCCTTLLLKFHHPLRYTPIHSGSLRSTPIHSDPLRSTPIHSDSLRNMHILTDDSCHHSIPPLHRRDAEPASDALWSLPRGHAPQLRVEGARAEAWLGPCRRSGQQLGLPSPPVRHVRSQGRRGGRPPVPLHQLSPGTLAKPPLAKNYNLDPKPKPILDANPMWRLNFGQRKGPRVVLI